MSFTPINLEKTKLANQQNVGMWYSSAYSRKVLQ